MARYKRTWKRSSARRRFARSYRARRAKRGYRTRGVRRGYRRRVTQATMAPPAKIQLKTAGLMKPIRYFDVEWRAAYTDVKPTYTGPAISKAINSVKCNSIYDPSGDLTGAFNTTTTLYQWMKQLYSKYEVVSSHAVFSLRQNQMFGAADASHDVPLMKWGVLYDDDGVGDCLSGTYTWLASAQRPTTKFRSFQPSMYPGHVQTIKMDWTKKVHNDVEQNQAEFDANPLDIDYWIPFIGYAVDGIVPAASFPDMSMEVYVRYRVKCTEPLDLESTTVAPHQDAAAPS